MAVNAVELALHDACLRPEERHQPGKIGLAAALARIGEFDERQCRALHRRWRDAAGDLLRQAAIERRQKRPRRVVPGIAEDLPDGAVSAMRPASSTSTWSQISRMTLISWVMSTMVSPRRRLISFKSERMDSVVSGSSADVASSQSRFPAADQRAGNADALLLAAGEPGGIGGLLPFEADERQHLPHPCRDFGRADARHEKRQGDIAEHGLGESRLKCWKIMPTRRRSATSSFSP